MADPRRDVALSVVAPVYNEAPNIRPLYEQITAALDGVVQDYEIVLVDDGSTDESFRADGSVPRG